MMVLPWLRQGLSTAVEVSPSTFKNHRYTKHGDYGPQTHLKTASQERVESDHKETAFDHRLLATCLALEFGVRCCQHSLPDIHWSYYGGVNACGSCFGVYRECTFPIVYRFSS
jgi:hypothetical protein